MSKYASLLFDTDEYQTIGPFRFPIYYTLLPGEAKGIEKITRENSKSTYKTIKLAQRIAKDMKLESTQAALDMLSSANQDGNQELLLNYASDLEALQEDNLSTTEQQTRFAELFIIYRGEAKVPGTPNWQKLSDWTSADTDETPMNVLEEIFQMVLWERDGWPKPESETSDSEGNETNEPQKTP